MLEFPVGSQAISAPWPAAVEALLSQQPASPGALLAWCGGVVGSWDWRFPEPCSSGRADPGKYWCRVPLKLVLSIPLTMRVGGLLFVFSGIAFTAAFRNVAQTLLTPGAYETSNQR